MGAGLLISVGSGISTSFTASWFVAPSKMQEKVWIKIGACLLKSGGLEEEPFFRLTLSVQRPTNPTRYSNWPAARRRGKCQNKQSWVQGQWEPVQLTNFNSENMLTYGHVSGIQDWLLTRAHCNSGIHIQCCKMVATLGVLLQEEEAVPGHFCFPPHLLEQVRQ